MSGSRLSLFAENGGVALPEGDIAVFGAGAGADLAAFPRDRLKLVSRVKPDHDRLKAAGFTVVTDAPDAAALAIVFLPRAKAQARAMVAHALALAGRAVIDGQKTDGIDSLLREMRGRADVTVGEPYSKAHGKVFVAEAVAGGLADWAEAGRPAQNRDDYCTMPGLFSADGVDPGSKLLAAALPAKLGRAVADFGAGWGYLAGEILKRGDVETLDLIEADLDALDCAMANVTDNRARFRWADATTWATRATLDCVVMNPPFHEGRKGVPELGAGFIRNAAASLAPAGRLFLVANRHLPYEAVLAERFREVSEIGGDNRFKLLQAARPSRGAARPAARPGR